MHPDVLIARTRAALEASDLSLPAHLVMCQVGYRMNVTTTELLRQAAISSEGDPRGTFTAADYREGLARCLRRGLLKVLEPDDFDGDGARTHLRDTQLARQDGFDDFAPGHVDFTAEGYRLHQAVIAAISCDLGHE